jgi:hypothetical protein
MCKQWKLEKKGGCPEYGTTMVLQIWLKKSSWLIFTKKCYSKEYTYKHNCTKFDKDTGYEYDGNLWLSQLNSASQAFWYLYKYSFRLSGEEQAGPDKDLFLPVDILQKWLNFFIV